jgi:hypothetical protein
MKLAARLCLPLVGLSACTVTPEQGTGLGTIEYCPPEGPCAPIDPAVAPPPGATYCPTVNPAATRSPETWSSMRSQLQSYGCSEPSRYSAVAGGTVWLGALCPKTDAVRNFVTTKESQLGTAYAWMSDSACDKALYRPPSGKAWVFYATFGPHCTGGCTQPFPEDW